MLKNLLVVFFVFLNQLYADSISGTLENDFFGSKEDNHYTNGVYLVWMQDANESDTFDFILPNHQTNTAISFSHQIFTPTDKEETEPIWNDLPYAGYMKLNFLLYKSTEHTFHEFGVNIAAVGPITQAEEIQTFFHKVVGDGKFKGWDNQLDDQFMAGISYQFAYKTDPMDIKGYKLDVISNIRADLGNFYSGALISSTLRLGSFEQNTFMTASSFMVMDESDLLNVRTVPDFNWDVSFGLLANATYNYYIIDEGIDRGYQNTPMDYGVGWQGTLNLYYEKFRYTYKIKSIHLNDQRHKRWGAMTVSWRF